MLTAFATYIQTTMIPVHTLNQLPVGACLKKAAPPLQIEEHRRYIETRRCEFWILRSIYKIYRWFFGGFWFYFLPFLPLYLPWVIIVIRQRCPTFYYPIFVNWITSRLKTCYNNKNDIETNYRLNKNSSLITIENKEGRTLNLKVLTSFPLAKTSNCICQLRW